MFSANKSEPLEAPRPQQARSPQQPQQSPPMPAGSQMLHGAGTPLIWPSLPSLDDRPLCPDLVEREAKGTMYAIVGMIKPHWQEERAEIKKASTNEVIGRIHIAEDARGSGIMVELVPRSSIAFIDTSCAVVEEGKSLSGVRDAKIISASEKMEIDPTRPPFGIVKAVGKNR